MLFRGDILEIVHRPIAVLFLAIAVFLSFSPAIAKIIGLRFSKPTFVDDGK
jgi:hypothetical protein